MKRVTELLAACELQTNLDRTKFPPWGANGGGEAAPGRFTLIRAGTDDEISVGKEKGLKLAAGDLVRVETGGGGGWGPATERSLAAIQRDLAEGYVTPAAALRDYGARAAQGAAACPLISESNPAPSAPALPAPSS